MRTLQPNIPFSEQNISEDFATEPFVTQHLTFQSYQIYLSGDLVGVVKLQATNTLETEDAWTDVTDATLSMDASIGSFGIIENFDACCAYYRIYFTYTSGTGSAGVLMFGKGNS